MITTKQPTDDMIEVAIVSMEEALSADGETVPAGCRQLARDPMRARPETPRARAAQDGARCRGSRTPASIDRRRPAGR